MTDSSLIPKSPRVAKPKVAAVAPGGANAQDLIFQREVAEELRQDQLKRLWSQYGTYVIAAFVAFVVGIAAYQQYKSSQLAAAQAAGAQYETTSRLAAQGKGAEATSALGTIAASGPAGYALLARLQLAASNQAADKSSDAVTGYDAVAASTNADPVLRDFAKLQAAALRLETADWTEMQNRLISLTDERSAFRATAREYLGLSAQKAGRTEDARKLFLQVLGDAKASKSAKERVGGYLSGITAASLAQPAVKAPPSAADAPKAPPAGEPASPASK